MMTTLKKCIHQFQSRFRGMAVKKVPKSSDFVCFLLDFGSLVTVSQNNMRPLPEAYLDIQPYAYQVIALLNL